MIRCCVAIVAAAVLAGCGVQGLSAPPDTGIQVRTLVGPTCPVQLASGSSCADAPYPASVDVRAQDGTLLTSFRTGANGQFRLALPPASYVLIALPASSGPPTPPAPQHVSVQPGSYTPAVLVYDSGIR